MLDSQEKQPLKEDHQDPELSAQRAANRGVTRPKQRLAYAAPKPERVHGACIEEQRGLKAHRTTAVRTCRYENELLSEKDQLNDHANNGRSEYTPDEHFAVTEGESRTDDTTSHITNRSNCADNPKHLAGRRKNKDSEQGVGENNKYLKDVRANEAKAHDTMHDW